MVRVMEKEVPCCIRGYHVYKAIWIAAIEEQLTCERQPTNPVNRHAVEVIRNRLVIGHLPKKCTGYFKYSSFQFCLHKKLH